MKTKFENFTSAIAKRDELMTQYAKMEEVDERNSTEAERLRTQLHDAEAAHLTCEKQHIRGLASADELSSAKTLMSSLREKHPEVARMSGLAQDALTEIEAEISKAQSLVQSTFATYCYGVKDDISNTLNDDKKIRNKMLEAYAAMVTAGIGYNGTWSLFLTGIYKEPSQEEIKAATGEFKTKYRLL